MAGARGNRTIECIPTAQHTIHQQLREREKDGWGGRRAKVSVGPENDEQGDRPWGRSSRTADQR